MEELLNRRAALAKTKTPWIFALITTGILVFMWSSIFIVWVVKRIRQGNGRLEYKHEKQSATQAEDYIIPPDPALIGKGGLVFDAEKARELFMKDNTSRAHSIQKETEGVNTAEPSALLSLPHASTNVN